MNASPIIVVGSGIAGLWAALKAAPQPVMMLTAGALGRQSATAWAQGGIAAALGEDDSPRQHAADTVAAGAGLVDESVAAELAGGAADQVRALEHLGVPFEHFDSGRWALSREAAHRRARIARVGGDRAGAAIVDALVRAVGHADHVTVREHARVVGLVADSQGGCGGVVIDGGHAGPEILTGRATVLATGGLGGLYSLTTNPPGNQGQGLAWAARLGATIRDPEFVQFHPTAIAVGKNPAPLATEALRGEGAVLVDRQGRRFMPDVHPDADLAPRDVVARAVHCQLASGAGAFLDATRAVGDAFPERFQAVFRACIAAGIDPVHEPIPVAPAAHYHMGGVAASLEGCTDVPRLFAVGEVSCTGAHGANRLASNSLAEALVMGAGAGETLAALSSRSPGRVRAYPAPALPRESLERLRRAMSAHAGVERSARGVGQLVELIDELESVSGPADALVTARLIADCAARRQESRGAHYRSDYPETAAAEQSSRIVLKSPAVQPVAIDC